MLKVFEAFAGIGTQRMALKNIGVEHEVVGISEIDKFAIKSYMAIHGETKNYGDISKINTGELPDFDLFTYSFPCQDISVAGEGRGLKQDTGTRSSLLWDCQDIIEAKKPKYILMENVKNLVGKKHKEQFDKWLEILSDLGYTNYWEILNAKDYEIPQNRERVFVVSILGEHKPYKFPKKKPLIYNLESFMLDEVDSKYYLTQEQADKIRLLDKYQNKEEPTTQILGGLGEINFGKQWRQGNRVYSSKGIATALTASPVGNAGGFSTLYTQTTKRLGGMFDTETKKRQAGAIWDKSYLSPTIDTMQGGFRQPLVFQEKNNETDKGIIKVQNRDNLVRKLTPLECWRLMGISEEDFHKAQKVNSDTQLYKQAGNAIVVNVLEEIFTNLFYNK